MLLGLENVLIFDFQDQEDIISNLDNYSDEIHYSKFINDCMLQYIFNKKHLIRDESWESIHNLEDILYRYGI
ncbi:hypothetical protein Bealeia1_00900 [Candidatus Bealeia paramacronuclearis]|uniref:Uncharacterized protein n=1 Tax=Candidatus Bealeia paramacronuclearis TaxID=1921001 RepID=A0ABZ2C3I1_9PROT|nr:hypothetical protein [Candidatus Bealeia paramacronuclearis]